MVFNDENCTVCTSTHDFGLSEKKPKLLMNY